MASRGRLITTPEHRKYKKAVEKLLKKVRLDTKPLQEKRLKVCIEYHNTFLNKNKSIKKTDIDNRAKTLIDVVFGKLKLDDSLIFELLQKKVDSKESKYAVLSIEELAMKNPDLSEPPDDSMKNFRT